MTSAASQTSPASAHPLSVLQRCTEANLFAAPYPHIMIEDALPEEYYTALEAALPDREALVAVEQRDSNPLICSYSKARANVPPIWQDFLDYHVSPQFVNEVMGWASRFKSQLFGGVAFDEVAEVARNPANIGIRRVGKHKINADCQLVNNAPGNTLLVGPHLDNPIEIYAALLYFRHPDDASEGGEFEVYACKPGFKTYGKDRFKHKYVALEKKVPYKRNTLAMFFNCPTACHGVTARVNAQHARRHVNIIGEYHKKLFDNTAMLSNSLWDKLLWKAQKRLGKVL